MKFQHLRDVKSIRSLGLAAAVLAGAGVAAHAGTREPTIASSSPVLVSSPAPERMAAREAWRFAEAFTAAHSDCDVMVGSGGSMRPLYPDHTMLIVRRLPMAELRCGMTVVFIGDRVECLAVGQQ